MTECRHDGSSFSFVASDLNSAAEEKVGTCSCAFPGFILATHGVPKLMASKRAQDIPSLSLELATRSASSMALSVMLWLTRGWYTIGGSSPSVRLRSSSRGNSARDGGNPAGEGGLPSVSRGNAAVSGGTLAGERGGGTQQFIARPVCHKCYLSTAGQVRQLRDPGVRAHVHDVEKRRGCLECLLSSIHAFVDHP